MNLMKKTVVVLLATAWLLTQAAKDVAVSFTDVMRYALGEDREPVSIAAFLAVMASSVFLIGITGTLIAVMKIN